MGEHILKEQIKIIHEDSFAVEPSYDSSKVIVVDATDWTLSPDQGLITQETLTTAGITVALPGRYALTGSTTIPARMSQIDRLNEIGFGYAVYKNVDVDTDGDGTTDYTMKASVATPSQKLLPTWTAYHLYPEPEIVDVVTGTVFTNMRVEFSTDKVLTYNYDITSVKNEERKATTAGWDPSTQPWAINEPMPIQDYVRALDANLYADIKVVKWDPSAATPGFVDNNGITYTPIDSDGDGYYEKVQDPDGEYWTLIDVVPLQEDGVTPTTIFDEVYYLIGRKIHGVSTVKLDLKVENAGKDAYRLGSRFANEYPIRKVIRQDYSGSMTIDFASTDTEDVDSIELYNLFINGARTEEVIKPTEAGIGKLSVVIKVGSAYDIKSTAAQADQRVPSAFGFKETDPLMYYSDISTPNLGAPNRCMYILPNVILEKADKKDSVGQLKTIDMTIRLLPDDELFKDYIVDDGSTTTSLADLRAFTVSWLK
jgi:hypothetical protein